MRFKAAFLLLSVVLTSQVYGQSAQATNNALMRTFMLATNFGTGTTFSIDIDNREYWVTAKHMFTGVKTGPAGTFTTKTVQANILSQAGEGEEGHDLHWIPTTFTTIDPGKDIDIIVLVPDHALLSDIAYKLASENASVPMGGDCEFLGYPYPFNGWKAQFSDGKQPEKLTAVWLPYIKHCTVSGRINEKGMLVWILDGINNHGFSGGPVLTGTGPNQKVFAVISGYYPEPLEVLPEAARGDAHTGFVPPPPPLAGKNHAPPPKQIVEANSGFILAFDLDAAIKAIRATPIGPLLPATTTSPTPSATPAPVNAQQHQ
jgi:hypothetical protein